MIQVKCGCGAEYAAPESGINQSKPCSACGQAMRLVCAEELPPDAGAADFDASLFLRNPAHDSDPRRFYLGGVRQIDIGRQSDATISLVGSQVSRLHCTLNRLDFGPSRWSITDHKSANGLYLNDQRVEEAELHHGDILRIGDFELVFELAGAARPARSATRAVPSVSLPHAPAAPPLTGGAPCPSCGTPLAPAAKICVDCGINVKTGRPLLMAKGVDEDALHVYAEGIIRWVSWIVALTPLPIPIASEGFGTKKPYAIWGITAVTILASLIFFIATWGHPDSSLNALMLWPPHTEQRIAIVLPAQAAQQWISSMTPSERMRLDAAKDKLRDQVPSDQLDIAAMQQLLGLNVIRPHPQFHWYQLLTHAFLHDNGSILGFLTHLGGNMLFLLVFGTRVNAVLGDWATLVLYPFLAVAAASFYLYMMPLGPPIPMLGASGAIMGLAGLYLVLFPLHRVYCAMWIRWGLFMGFRISLKIFTLRGFWVLLIYFAYDVLMGLLTRHHVGGGTAHWAHFGGFTAGALIALLILFSRQINTFGGDLLSVLLGRRAWPLIGKPAQWKSPALMPRRV
jgi:membrane associated rhomboid family serine protease/pSer/pThr/pTyr-binding forkhead associated (FHA) protein